MDPSTVTNPQPVGGTQQQMQQQQMQMQAAGMPQQLQAPGAPPKPPAKLKRRVLTSLTLQIFIYFGGWWDVVYFILNILVFVYKGLNLPYPSQNFAMEFSFSWLWFLIEIPRLFLASKGNKTERTAPLFFSMILGAPLIAMYVYFVAFQTYVLKADVIFNAVALAFVGIQYLLMIIVAVKFIVATRFA